MLCFNRDMVLKKTESGREMPSSDDVRSCIHTHLQQSMPELIDPELLALYDEADSPDQPTDTFG